MSCSAGSKDPARPRIRRHCPHRHGRTRKRLSWSDCPNQARLRSLRYHCRLHCHSNLIHPLEVRQPNQLSKSNHFNGIFKIEKRSVRQICQPRCSSKIRRSSPRTARCGERVGCALAPTLCFPANSSRFSSLISFRIVPIVVPYRLSPPPVDS